MIKLRDTLETDEKKAIIFRNSADAREIVRQGDGRYVIEESASSDPLLQPGAGKKSQPKPDPAIASLTAENERLKAELKAALADKGKPAKA